ncbi:hypothetical protein [Paraburkholderia sp. SIMBA_054]|uniref:hypothetical protein n=1 Tax=Paraburkholderia sp. SIMBA_054 TaxID=3085795 RepID=UPI00397B6FE1
MTEQAKSHRRAPAVRVRPVPAIDGERAEWRITANLTDRDGNIRRRAFIKRGGNPLLLDPAAYERLGEQMYSDLTCIAVKDGQFGILFQPEMFSRESYPPRPGVIEPVDGVRGHVGEDLPTAAVIVEKLVDALLPIAAAFPAVQFAIPDEAEFRDGRPVVWAFVRDGALEERDREELASRLESMCDDASQPDFG